MKTKFVALGISLLLFSVTTIASAQTATNPATTRRDTAKERLETRKEGLETRKENIQDKIDNLQERIASREATLKQRLGKFKDKLKVERIERINKNLSMINSKRIDIANRFLANATRILDKLQERVRTEAGKGKDATTANSAILDARAKIASASGAVASQSLMDYTVSISSESAAKTEIKVTRDGLHSDWQNVRSLLTAAKQAVANAITVAVTTMGGTK